ncbi:MAG: hypothetical protein ACSHX5_10320 [Phycisphaerales bacterium]
MKRTLLLLALLATTPLLTGCEISKSFSIHKDRSCGCHGPRHHQHCSHKSKHRGSRTGSHDPLIPDHPDRGHDIFTHRIASSSIARVNHGTIANRSITPRPKPTRSRPRAVSKASSNHALSPDSKRTKANIIKQKKVSMKRGR